MEAIRASITTIIGRLDNFKTQGDAVAQQVARVCGDLEAAMLKVNENFRRMAEDFNAQRQVINSLGESMGDWRREQQEYRMRLALSFDDLRRMNNTLSNRLGAEIAQGERLCQDVALLMAWTKEQEDGTMVMLSERLQKLEDRMAEKDQEIANLREKVHLSSCRDCLRLMINDRHATVVRLVWRYRRKRSLNRYLLLHVTVFSEADQEF